VTDSELWGRSMESGDEIRQLLREIRDAQREHLAEYRRVAERSLELQQRAVARQEQLGQFSRKLIGVGGILVVALLALLVYLLARWWRYLFGM
jgi:ferric-dicitrate binding protein FerR (iron transport regulator)